MTLIGIVQGPRETSERITMICAAKLYFISEKVVLSLSVPKRPKTQADEHDYVITLPKHSTLCGENYVAKRK